jgi:hypothetical protein
MRIGLANYFSFQCAGAPENAETGFNAEIAEIPEIITSAISSISALITSPRFSGARGQTAVERAS